MAARALLFAAVAAATLFALSRCTLITGNYNECSRDSDCSGGRICVAATAGAAEHYCVPQTIPQGCLGVPDAGIAAVYGPVDAGNAIHLGATYAITTSTGPSQSPIAELDGVLLALEEINQRAVGGRPFVLHICDTQSRTDLLQTQVTWMTDQLKVPAIIIPDSDQVLAAAGITIPRGVVVMSPSATSPEITSLAATSDGGTRLVWRTAPSDSLQGAVISELLLGTGSYDAGVAGAQRVGILYLNDPYGQGLSGTVLTALTSAQPAKTTQAFQYNRGDTTSINTAVAELDSYIGGASGSPTITVMIAFPEDAPRIVSDGETTTHLRRSAGHRWFFTDSAKDPAIISQSPAGVLEGDYGTAPAQGAGSGFVFFQSRYSARFGMDPSNFAFTAHSYDAMYVLALGAAYAAGPDGTGAVTGERMAEGMTKLSSGPSIQLGPTGFTPAASTLATGGSIDIDGTSGQLNFNSATGEAPSPIELWQIQDGGFQTVTTLTP